MNSKSLSDFKDKLFTDWLPSFCDAPHRNHSTDGFVKETINKLTTHDAQWFLRAIDLGIVNESGGFFTAPLSKAKEQIFWTGSKKISPRPLTLWVEPIITIGALAKLHVLHDWPINKLGAQSATWAFDLVGYGVDADDEALACEVKKSQTEIDALINLMEHFAKDSTLEEPPKGKERNAYKKVAGIKRSWPSVFWALGPNNYSYVFEISRQKNNEIIFIKQQEDYLNFESLNKRRQSD